MASAIASTQRVARLGWALFVTVLKRRLAYRGDLIIQSLDEALRGVLAIVLIQVYMSKAPNLHGWSEPELLFILGFAMIPLALFHCFCGNLYGLAGRYILEGQFDRILLRPYPSFLQVCFDRIAIEDLSGAVLGAGLMIVAAQRGATVAMGPAEIALLIGLLICAFLIVVAVFMAFASLSFWFDDRVGMVPPVYNLMEFGRWPVAIYNDVIRLLVTALIPFSFCAFYPASMFTNSGSQEPTWWYALLTPLVAAIALTISCRLWRAGIRRYGSTGN
ncbi:MAG: ABC-2 family transporter protein [Planctomycetota bacterium]|jgi:ABC-2 type transport system permease protein|nr:ABC-2 family transporter protein [Planctomycetota bacterium]